jgi:2'-5' RNA ligase
MPKITRTFVAVTIPENKTKKLESLQALIEQSAKGMRWVKPEAMHVTVAFLGDVPETELADVCRAVANSALEFPPFELRLQGMGAFPSAARPRTVWAGLGGPGVDVLIPLQRVVAKSLGQLGYHSQDDRFHPHVTLGRVKGEKQSAPDLRQASERFNDWSGGLFEVSELVVFASQLTPDGSVYAPLARAALSGQKTVSPP